MDGPEIWRVLFNFLINYFSNIGGGARHGWTRGMERVTLSTLATAFLSVALAPGKNKKGCSAVNLYCKYTWALTFENLWQ
jgi:hypothetical protein